ncbi:MAG: SUMF1/EgtB/PvdO family nonheme iron enzyme [Polyangiaceae bacterium]
MINERAAGALVSVEKGETEVGFARGKVRVTEKTEGFRISKHPITRKQYESCQKAGACQKPELDECSDQALAKRSFKGDQENVAICVGRANAEAFCKWVGGRLPTLVEWLRAARGPKVQRFPWGGVAASCAQHPQSAQLRAKRLESAEDDIALAGCESDPVTALRTGRHPAGAASVSQMEDILLAPAELVDGSDHVVFGSCVQQQGCLVYGSSAGAIDSVQPYATGHAREAEDNETSKLTPLAYQFRCTFEK